MNYIAGNYIAKQSPNNWTEIGELTRPPFGDYNLPFNLNDLIYIDVKYGNIFFITKKELYYANNSSDNHSCSWPPDNNRNQVDNKSVIQLIDLPIKITPLSYILKIVSGEGHNIVLMSTGEIIVFGSNTNGQLGISNFCKVNKPTLVPSSEFNGEKIRDVACGYYHTLILTESGIVYASGRNSNNQIGCTLKNRDVSKFVPITFQKNNVCYSDGGKNLKIKKIISGSHHSLFLTEDGIAYATGDDNFYALGKNRGTYTIFSPLEPFYSEQIHIKNIWCGSLSTFVQTVDDIIYVCGTNNDNALFLKNVDQKTDGFVMCEYLSKKSIQSISGFYSMIAVSETRDVYVCGNNVVNQLNKDNQMPNSPPRFEPMLSEMLKKYDNFNYYFSSGFRACGLSLYKDKHYNPIYSRLINFLFNSEINKKFSDIDIVCSH